VIVALLVYFKTLNVPICARFWNCDRFFHSIRKAKVLFKVSVNFITMRFICFTGFPVRVAISASLYSARFHLATIC